MAEARNLRSSRNGSAEHGGQIFRSGPNMAATTLDGRCAWRGRNKTWSKLYCAGDSSSFDRSTSEEHGHRMLPRQGNETAIFKRDTRVLQQKPRTGKL